MALATGGVTVGSALTATGAQAAPAVDNTAAITVDPLLVAVHTKYAAALGAPLAPAQDYGAGKMQVFAKGGLFVRTRVTGAAVIMVNGPVWTAWQNQEKTAHRLGLPVNGRMPFYSQGEYQQFDLGAVYVRGSNPTPRVVNREFFRQFMGAGGLLKLGWPTTDIVGDGAWTYSQKYSSGIRILSSAKSPLVTGVSPQLGAAIDAAGGTSTFGYLTSVAFAERCNMHRLNFSNRQLRVRGDNRWCPAPQFAQPAVTMTKPPSGYNISLGWGMGKVNIVTSKLGLPWQYNNYGWREQQAVRNFQSRNGLKVTGVVDRVTWDRMKTGTAWNIDGWQTNVVSPLTASRDQRVEQMIGFAMSQRGSKYIFGGTGPYHLGYACSGIVYQAMISAGVDPYPWTWVQTAAPNSWGNRMMYNNWTRWQHVPLAQMKRGDLVYWDGDRDGQTDHVGIYLGNNQVLDSVYVPGKRGGVAVTPFQRTYFGMPVAPYAVRPFADNAM